MCDYVCLYLLMKLEISMLKENLDVRTEVHRKMKLEPRHLEARYNTVVKMLTLFTVNSDLIPSTVHAPLSTAWRDS